MRPSARLATVCVLLLSAWVDAAEPRSRQSNHLLRLKSGQEIPILPGWEASFERGSFWFEYIQPRRLACTLPLQDVEEIELDDGTIVRNTYVPPGQTFTNHAIIDVYGAIVEHEGRYPTGGTVNWRGWNSRTGEYETP